MSIRIAVMQAVQMWRHNDFALQLVRGLRPLFFESSRNPLLNALMRSELIVVGGKLFHNAMQLLLAEDEEMVTALAF